MLDTITKLHSSRILVVDDSEINRIFLEKSLRLRGLTEIMCVQNAEEALEVIFSYNPDLVILDIVMPGMDGFECCQIIRRYPEFKNLPILIQTVISEPELRFKAFKMGATDFISKPIYPDELYARVLVHLEKQILLNDLQTYKKRVEMELDSARKLQLSILPNAHNKEWEDLPCDIAAHFCPSSEVGGDFWGMKVFSEHEFALWITDTSGHGVASAMHGFRLQAYMNEHSVSGFDPGEYLTLINSHMLSMATPGQFATVFYGVINLKTQTLAYAAAAHPHPMILRHGSKRVEMLDGKGKPLGIVPATYTTRNTHFMPEDALFLYSDTLIETAKKNGESFAEEEITDILSHTELPSSEAILAHLLERFTHETGNLIRDDLTLCVFRGQK